MRKPCFAFLGLLLWAAAESAPAQFTCVTNAGNTLTITGYAGSNVNVSIPAAIGGLAVTDIGTNAFAGSSVASVIIPVGVINIEDFAFSQCSGLTNVTIPSGVAGIATGAFDACSSLASLAIPDGVTNIGDLAFTFCSGLGSLTIPGSVGRIGQAAFQACAGLTNVTLVNGVASIGNDAFLDCSSLRQIRIPGSVTNIGQSAFQNCASLETASIASGVTSIGTQMFASCQSLRSISMADSVTNIGAYAFAGAGLDSVTIPGSVAVIGDGAFSGTSLTEVALSSNVTSIGTNAFCICSNLAGITVTGPNPFFSSVHGVLFDASQATLIQYPAALGAGGTWVIPNGVNHIAAGAFAGSGLAGVTIPASVNHIGENAFYACAGLGIVFFEGNAPATDPSAFDPDTNAVIYYLPGATGWSSPFAGLAALLWNPMFQTCGANFGVRNNQFGFNITGTDGIVLVVQACANLANPAWQPVQTVTLAGGSYYFSQPVAAGGSGRFYRFSSP